MTYGATARRTPLQRADSRAGRPSRTIAITRSWVPACRAAIFPAKARGKTHISSMCGCRACCTGEWCGPAVRARYFHGAARWSAVDHRFHPRHPRSAGGSRVTSWAWSRRRSGHAVQAAQRLQVTWDMPADVAGVAGGLARPTMRTAQTIDADCAGSRRHARRRSTRAEHVASGRYESPNSCTGRFARICAIADVKADSALIFTSAQSVYSITRERVRRGTGPAGSRRCTVRYLRIVSRSYGRGCSRRRGAGGRLMSREAGAPVRLQFMRWDEHGWDHYSRPIRRGQDRLRRRRAKSSRYEYTGGGMPSRSTGHHRDASGSRRPATRLTACGPGAHSVQCGDQYTLPNWRIVNHRCPACEGYFKAAPLRSPFGHPHSSFAASRRSIDLAYAPTSIRIEFRRKNIKGERWLGVLDAVAKASNWTPRRAASI